MSPIAEEQDLSQITNLLTKEGNLDSLLYLVEKLPDLAKAVQTIDEGVAFTQNTLHDKASMNALFQEAEEKLEMDSLNTENFHALIKMFQLLPTVVPLMEKLIDVGTFVTETVQDKDSMESLFNEMSTVTEPLDVLKETNRRVKEDKQLPSVSIFKLLHLLKDPTVRKGYKYVNTLLNVLSEGNEKKA